MIAVPFALAGILKSFNLSTKVRQAKLIHSFFSEIKESIRFLGAETNEIVNSILKKDEYKELGANFNTIFNEGKKVCNSAFERIGKTDTVGQIEHLNAVLKKLELLIIKCEKEREEKAKLYLTLGLCTGVMATIIII